MPGGPDEPLRCGLIRSSLVQHPPYKALSYVWGSNTDSIEIEIAGRQIPISKTLKTILSRLRLPLERRILWIDQLCIDQSNLEEKSAQVRKMGFIYSKCNRGIIWMGEFANGVRPEDAEGAFAVFEHLALNEIEANSERPRCIASKESFEAAMRALATISIYKGVWWNRVWTVQEAILPSDAVYVWGPLSLPWNTIVSATSTWVSTALHNYMTLEQRQTAVNVGRMGI